MLLVVCVFKMQCQIFCKSRMQEHWLTGIFSNPLSKQKKKKHRKKKLKREFGRKLKKKPLKK